MAETILRVDGAHCASCAFAIEKHGRKVPGIEDVRVYPGRQEIHVHHAADRDITADMIKVVEQLGCHAAIIEPETGEGT